MGADQPAHPAAALSAAVALPGALREQVSCGSKKCAKSGRKFGFKLYHASALAIKRAKETLRARLEAELASISQLAKDEMAEIERGRAAVAQRRRPGHLDAVAADDLQQRVRRRRRHAQLRARGGH